MAPENRLKTPRLEGVFYINFDYTLSFIAGPIVVQSTAVWM